MSKPKSATPAALTATEAAGTRPVTATLAPKPAPPVVRHASGRIVRFKAGSPIAAAHLNAVIEDLEATQKQVAKLEKAMAPKAVPAKSKPASETK